MGDWKSLLNAYPVDWLLEENNPSVRYFTLTGLLGRGRDDPGVLAARKSIMECGPVPGILEKQSRGGYWGKPDDFYIRSKYKGTVWTLILLAELGADGADPRIRKACEFILGASQDPESGGFGYASLKGGGLHEAVLPCLTGNMLWCLIKFGRLEDERVQRGIDFITKYQRFDDRIDRSPTGWPYDKFKQCWGKHTCHYGVVKALKALAEIPAPARSGAVTATIEAGAEYLLEHRIFKSSRDPGRVAMAEWLRLGFPHMWETDVVEVLGLLARLGYRDERMQDAIDAVLSRQGADGRWLQESTFPGRYIVRMEPDGRPGKWVTLNALRTLKTLLS